MARPSFRLGGNVRLPARNDLFERFARYFTGEQVDPQGAEIVTPPLLRRMVLDYSVPSLYEVDVYCTRIGEDRDLLKANHRPGDSAVGRTIVWGGAYVGEVIRRNAEIALTWVDYDAYATAFPMFPARSGARTVHTYARLCRPDGASSNPFVEILRRILRGPGASVHAHARAQLGSQRFDYPG